MRSKYLRPFVVRYVTLFVERSGSTYLATLLDSHPDVLAKREEFAHLRQRGATGHEQLDWAREFWTPPWLGRHKAIGFKTKLVDILDVPGFSSLLHDYHVRIIQLQRRNIVKAAVSTLNAKRLYEASGNWNLLKESDRLPGFTVDPDQFDQLLQERIGWDKELEGYAATLKLPRIQLFYEDLISDEQQFLDRVQGFLGVPAKPVKGKTLKNTSDDLREVLLNFEEIRERYSGTPFYAMFSEGTA